MSENSLFSKALLVLVAVLILGMVGIVIGVRPTSVNAQVVDRSGNYLAAVGTTATRGEQVLYLVNTREQIMIVYKYDTSRKALVNLASTNLEKDFTDAKTELETSEGALFEKRRSSGNKYR